jgi:hypothetical protein
MKRSFSGASTQFPLLAPLLASTLTMLTIGFIGAGTIAPAQAKPVTDIPTLPERLAAEDAKFWVPVARLSTDKPQRIMVHNKTGVLLEYLITTHTDFRVLEPGKSATLSNIETPLFLNINTQESNYRVKYTAAVDKKSNTLNVTVTLTNGEDNRTLNVNETGAVYLY